MTMIPESRREHASSPPRAGGELHPALYLVIGFALLVGIAFGVHGLFGLL